MDIKHGSFLCAVMWMQLVGAVPQLDVHFVSKSGQVIQDPELGIPTTLEVVVRNAGQAPERPVIGSFGSAKVVAQSTRTSVSVINGASTSEYVYVYELLFSQEGATTLGPVEVTTQEGRLRRAAWTCTPQQQAAVSATGGVQWIVDEQTWYVGQQVPYTVRWFMPSRDAHVEQVIVPPFDDVTMQQVSGPVQTTALHAGKSVACVEWKGFLIAHKPGRLVLPALRLVYTQEERADRFFGFFTTRAARELYSSVVTADVLPLPVTDQPAWAVGVVQGYSFELEKNSWDCCKAVTAKIIIHGHGNFALQEHPRLFLSDQMRWYAGKKEAAHDYSATTFEYALQALKPGTYTIPEQSMIIFNPEHEQYEILQTEPFEVVITGIPATCADVASAAESVQAENTAHDQPEVTVDLRLGVVQKWSLPWWLFMMLFLLPFIVVVLIFLRTKSVMYEQRNGFPWAMRQAARAARKRVHRACMQQDVAALYVLFVQYAQYMQLYSSGCESAYSSYKGYPFVWFDQYPYLHEDVDVGEDFWRNFACVQAQPDTWKSFWFAVCQAAYGSTALSENEKKMLCKDACTWIDALTKKSSYKKIVTVFLLSIAGGMFAQDLPLHQQLIQYARIEDCGTLQQKEYARHEIMRLTHEHGIAWVDRHYRLPVVHWYVYGSMPRVAWQLLVLVLWLLFFLLIYGSMVGVHWCRRIRWVVVAFVCVLMIPVVDDYCAQAQERVVVSAPEGSQLRVYPHEEYPVQLAVGYGHAFLVLKNSGQWKLVRDSDTLGWIKSLDVCNEMDCS